MKIFINDNKKIKKIIGRKKKKSTEIIIVILFSFSIIEADSTLSLQLQLLLLLLTYDSQQCLLNAHAVLPNHFHYY